MQGFGKDDVDITAADGNLAPSIASGDACPAWPVKRVPCLRADAKQEAVNRP